MALSDLIRNFGNTFVRELEKNLPPQKDSTGRLRGSIRVSFRFFTDTYSADILMEDYWKWVDKGRKPGKLPPFNSIASWVNSKRTLSAATNKRRIVTKKNSLSSLRSKQKNKVIESIRWGIYRRGIKATPFFSKTMKTTFVTDFKNAVAKEYKKDVIVKIKSWQ